MIKNILVAAVALSLFTASCGKSRAVYARNNSVEPNAASDLNSKNNSGDNLNNLDNLNNKNKNAEDLAILNDGKNNILDPNSLAIFQQTHRAAHQAAAATAARR